MPKPIPSSLAESMPQHQNVSPASDEVLRVLGGTGLPDDSRVARLSGDTDSSHETGALSWDVANETYTSTMQLYKEMVPGAEAPDMRDFIEAGVDFGKLQAGYEAYKAAGFKPELIFAPLNAGIDFWRGVYGSLCDWQDNNPPSNNSYTLQRRGDGDGLYIADSVAKNWVPLNAEVANSSSMGAHTIAPGGIVWKALVVPTASVEDGGLAVNTSFDLSTNSEQFHTQIAAIRDSLDGELNASNAHMPVGAYLMMEAMHLYKDRPLMEGYKWTWNAGTFKDANNNLRAPAAVWVPGVGQVGVYHGLVDRSDAYLGVRLPVWG